MRALPVVVFAVLAVLAVLAPALAAPAAARADDREDTSRPQIQADLGLSVIGLAYEQPLGSHVALQAEVDSTSTYFASWFDAGHTVSGWAIGLRATYFLRAGERGLYLAPFVRGARVTADRVDGAGYGVSAGAFVGWAWRVTSHLDIRIGAGAQYYDYEVHDTGMRTPFFALDGVIGWRL